MNRFHHRSFGQCVERARGFVEDQRRGIVKQRAGDADALTLAAGKGMGIAFQVMPVQAHQLQQLLNQCCPFCGGPNSVDNQWFRDNFPNRHTWV